MATLFSEKFYKSLIGLYTTNTITTTKPYSTKWGQLAT